MADYLKSILNAFQDLLFVFSSDGVIEDFITSLHEDELILPQEAFLGKNFKDVLPPHISKNIKKAFLELEKGQQQYSFDYNIEVKGKEQWYTAVISKIQYDNKSGYLGAVRNITARKSYELLLRGILNTSPGGILVLQAIRDTDDTIIDFEATHMNDSVEILTGVSESELIGQRITGMVGVGVSMKNKIMNQFCEVMKTGNHVDFQYHHTNRKGEGFWYHSKVVKYRDGVISTFMDITKQKKTEDDLEAKNEELRELNRQKDKLFSVISHDLRNAVSGAKGVYDMILEDYQNFSKAEIHEYLKILNISSRNTFELMDDLLAWSKNQFQEVTTNIEQLHIAGLTDSVFDKVKSSAEFKGISLLNQVDDTAIAQADANMMKIILRNLVSNAIKFSKSGDEVVVQAEETDEKVKISVIDEGVGIENSALEKILDKKSTYTTLGTKGEKGSGIGLDLCIDFIEMHGGTIQVDSEPGKGSAFTIILPRKMR